MICSNCKMEIPDDSVFCQYCGQALMQKVKIEDGIKKKSKKPIVVILLVAVFLSIAAFGAYFGTYLAAVNKAQEGDVEEARKLLICPSITKIHDPDLLPYLSAWEQLNSRDVSGYLLIESLAKEKDYSLAVQNLPSAKIAAYHHGLKLYEEGQLRAARKFFLALDSFENSKEYLVLIDATDYNALVGLIGFHDANEIILREYPMEFLTGIWATRDEKDYFMIFENGQSYTTLPLEEMENTKYGIENGIYYLFDGNTSSADYIKGNYIKKNVLRFTIVSADKIKVYCYKDGKTYIMYRT